MALAYISLPLLAMRKRQPSLPMAAKDHRPNSAPVIGATVRICLLATTLLILQAIPLADAQQLTERPSASEDNPYNTSISPALAILVVAIVSAFFLLGFFSVYLRRCTGDRSAVMPAGIAGIVGLGGGRSRRGAHRGLESSVLEKFPTILYSAVKGQKLGKESLECAVCLCEFEDDDILRLLPRCSHVFHRDCIDIWLASHVTCPVCRFNLAEADEDPPPETEHVVIEVDVDAVEVVEGEDRNAELADLVRIGSQRREAAARSRFGSVKRMPIGSRSIVDWEAVVTAASSGGGERFRLQLPDDLRQEILASEQLRRSASIAVFPARGEGSSRRGYREGIERGWRSLRIGSSGRWPFLGRSLSVNGKGETAATEERSVPCSSTGLRVSPEPLGSNDGGRERTVDALIRATAPQNPVSKFEE